MLFSKHEGVALKYYNDSKAFIEYSNDTDDIYKSIKKDNPNKERKILIVFSDMITGMLSYKNLNPTVPELFIILPFLFLSYLVFIFCFAVPKSIRLDFTHYFIMKIYPKTHTHTHAHTHTSSLFSGAIFFFFVKFD